MSQHYYADGAIHNDHHKEINIGSVTSNDLKEIVKGVFKNDDVVDAEVDCYEHLTKTRKSRGPRKKFLFALDGIDTKENETVKMREKERLKTYLSKHCLKSRKLVCTKDDTLNKTIVCFLKKWMGMGLTTEGPSGSAVFRFLTEDCGIESDVQEKAYGNRVKEWMKEKNDYDTYVMMMVKDTFDI